MTWNEFFKEPKPGVGSGVAEADVLPSLVTTRALSHHLHYLSHTGLQPWHPGRMLVVGDVAGGANGR